jgi:hypothetical protein
LIGALPSEIVWVSGPARPGRGCGITSTGGEGQIAACRPEGVWTPYPQERCGEPR